MEVFWRCREEKLFDMTSSALLSCPFFLVGQGPLVGCLVRWPRVDLNRSLYLPAKCPFFSFLLFIKDW